LSSTSGKSWSPLDSSPESDNVVATAANIDRNNAVTEEEEEDDDDDYVANVVAAARSVVAAAAARNNVNIEGEGDDEESDDDDYIPLTTTYQIGRGLMSPLLLHREDGDHNNDHDEFFQDHPEGDNIRHERDLGELIDNQTSSPVAEIAFDPSSFSLSQHENETGDNDLDQSNNQEQQQQYYRGFYKTQLTEADKGGGIGGMAAKSNVSIYRTQREEPYYRPISSWIGRLIFTPQNHLPYDCINRHKFKDNKSGKLSAVSIEIEHAPAKYRHYIGKTVDLRYNVFTNKPILRYCQLTTGDVILSEAGKEKLRRNEFLKPPFRLHYERGVGPLESLAGSRNVNDVHVILPEKGIVFREDGTPPVLLGKEIKKKTKKKLMEEWKNQMKKKRPSYFYGIDYDDDDNYDGLDLDSDDEDIHLSKSGHKKEDDQSSSSSDSDSSSGSSSGSSDEYVTPPSSSSLPSSSSSSSSSSSPPRTPSPSSLTPSSSTFINSNNVNSNSNLQNIGEYSSNENSSASSSPAPSSGSSSPQDDNDDNDDNEDNHNNSSSKKNYHNNNNNNNNDGKNPTIYLNDHPIQVSGVYYCVAKFIRKCGGRGKMGDFPFWEIQHYNPKSQSFDDDHGSGSSNTKSGNKRRRKEIICFPQAQRLIFTKEDTAYPSTNINIDLSPENKYGFYLYGTFVRYDDIADQRGNSGSRKGNGQGKNDVTNSDDSAGRKQYIFRVSAIEPFRALCVHDVDQFITKRQQPQPQPQPKQQQLLSPLTIRRRKKTSKKAIKFIHYKNFKSMKSRVGTLRSTLIDLQCNSKVDAISMWEEGDQMIVVHNAGGVKSTTYNHDSKLGFVAGHFSYGYATVVRDPLTKQLRFDIDYIQVYGTTTIGAISGAIKRQCFVGCIHLGYLGLRPVSDCLVKLNTVSREFKIGTKLSLCPLEELKEQLHIMSARYRIGDGLGVMDITSKSNCAQDSNQALYVAIDKSGYILQRMLRKKQQKNESNWDFKNVVDEAEMEQLQKLKKLGAQLFSKLAPFGKVRWDWKENAKSIASVKKKKKGNFISTLTSYKTIFPRRVYDVMLKVFLKNDAKLWFITTAAVGGEQHDHIVPLAPKKLLPCISM